MNARLRFEILRRDGFRCFYCGEAAPDVVLHVDHVKPRHHGGTNHPDNLVTACKNCNLGKHIGPAWAPTFNSKSAYAKTLALEAMLELAFKERGQLIDIFREYAGQHHCGCNDEQRLSKTVKEIDQGYSE